MYMDEIFEIALGVVSAGLVILFVIIFWGLISETVGLNGIQTQAELVPDTTFTTDEGHVIKMYNGKQMIGDYDNPAYKRMVDSIAGLVNIDSVKTDAEGGVTYYYQDPEGNLQQGIKPNFIDSLPRLERIGITP